MHTGVRGWNLITKYIQSATHLIEQVDAEQREEGSSHENLELIKIQLERVEIELNAVNVLLAEYQQNVAYLHNTAERVAHQLTIEKHYITVSDTVKN